MNVKSDRYIIQNVARALKILESLAVEQDGASISELAHKFDIPVNSTFRIIKSLESFGYVEEDSRRYHSTPRLLYMGYAGMNKKGLVHNSIEMMHSLRDDINETVMLGTLTSNQIVIIEQLPSFEFVKFTADIGHRVPVYASAPGKAILAYLPKTEQGAVLSHINFRRFNDNTIPGRKVMEDEISAIREAGFSVDRGEEVSGIICVAAPVLDYRGYPIASIWVTGPDFRMLEKGLENIGLHVMRTASAISKRFGYDCPPRSRKVPEAEA